LFSFSHLEVVEHACGVPSLLLGETLPNISKDLDTHSYRVPLGVTAGITPFNFPAMIPLWVSSTFFLYNVEYSQRKRKRLHVFVTHY
jgi:acyl-CoA reductase-like NAD-dependent aldehyde dehydrogenase